ncbi:MAG: C13 family peptidase, partial [Lentisphaerota bacterium]
DGTNPAVDYIKYDFDLDEEFYLSTPPDFDGDGTNDITGAASAANVSNAFMELASRLTPQDQLLMFTIDHGAPSTDAGCGEWDVELCLWYEERLRDVELKALTTNIPCPILFVMGQCMSGGFADDLNQPNRLLATAAEHDQSSFADWYIDPWCYAWAAAMRGCFMSTNHVPWEDGAPCNADYNGDGYVSFREASHFADLNKADGDSPTYQDVPAFLGSQKFLGDVSEAPVRAAFERYVVNGIRSPEAVSQPANFQVCALNAFGEVLTNYDGALQLSTTADDIDPGIYVGAGKIAWDPPLCAWSLQWRCQAIYPTNLMGGAQGIDDLALNVTATSTPMCHWTIRMKHTSLEAYPSNPAWEGSGWTTVYQADRNYTNIGWTRLLLTTSFSYTGVDSLMVDFSGSNEVWQPGGFCMAGTSDVSRTIWNYGYAGHTYGDPLDWSGTTNPIPEFRYKFPALRFGPPSIPVFVDVQPTNLTGFTNGIWSGHLQFSGPAPHMHMHLVSTNAYWNSSSDYFTVLDYLFELSEPQVGAEDACLLSWNSGTGATYRIALSTNLLTGYVQMVTNIPSTPPLNIYTTFTDSAFAIFRVEEE